MLPNRMCTVNFPCRLVRNKEKKEQYMELSMVGQTSAERIVTEMYMEINHED